MTKMKMGTLFSRSPSAAKAYIRGMIDGRMGCVQVDSRGVCMTPFAAGCVESYRICRKQQIAHLQKQYASLAEEGMQLMYEYKAVEAMDLDASRFGDGVRRQKLKHLADRIIHLAVKIRSAEQEAASAIDTCRRRFDRKLYSYFMGMYMVISEVDVERSGSLRQVMAEEDRAVLDEKPHLEAAQEFVRFADTLIH